MCLQRLQIRRIGIGRFQVSQNNFRAIGAHLQVARAVDDFPRHDLIAAFGTEYLTAETAMVLPAEGGKLLRTFVAFSGLRVGHPELMQLGVFIARQIVLKNERISLALGSSAPPSGIRQSVLTVVRAAIKLPMRWITLGGDLLSLWPASSGPNAALAFGPVSFWFVSFDTNGSDETEAELLLSECVGVDVCVADEVEALKTDEAALGTTFTVLYPLLYAFVILFTNFDNRVSGSVSKSRANSVNLVGECRFRFISHSIDSNGLNCTMFFCCLLFTFIYFCGVIMFACFFNSRSIPFYPEVMLI